MGMVRRGMAPALPARRLAHDTPTFAILLSAVGVLALV